MEKRILALSCVFIMVFLFGCKAKIDVNVSNQSETSNVSTSAVPSDTQNVNSAVAQSQTGVSSQTPQSTSSIAKASSTATVTNDPITQNNVMPLYFDLLDYMRTQSLGANFTTASAERTRVSNLVSTNWGQIDATTKNTLTGIAQLGQTVKSSYTALSQAQKDAKKAEWKKVVLSPNWLYAPLSNPKTYSSGGISFCYPNNWQYAETTGYMFMGPALANSWDQAGAAKDSPNGVLSAIFTNDMNGKSFLEVARLCATQYVNGNAPDMKEINAFQTNLGAVVVLNGKFPGQSDEKFFWVVIIPQGNYVALCRMGGYVKDADALIPAFYNMLNTLNWSTTPAGGGSSGGVVSAFDTAWSRVSTAIVTDIWAK